MIEFLGDFSLEAGINRLKSVSEKTVVVVPTNEIKEKLKSAIDSPKINVLREFEAALTFFEGKYPIALVRELLCLRVIRSKEGAAAVKELFPLREPGVSEARTLLKLFDELFILRQSAAFISEELTRLIHPEAERWRQLTILERQYLKELSKEGFKFEQSKINSKIILFGLLELSPLLKQVIAKRDVTAWVFDTADRAATFNQLGEVVSQETQFKLPPSEFIQSPREYVAASDGFLKSSTCGIVLFDELEQKIVTQQLLERGFDLEIKERSALPLVSTLVKAALEAISSERLFDLYSLLRIAAVEEILAKEIKEIPEKGLITAVDEYQADRLQLKWSSSDLPDGKNLSVVSEVLSQLKKRFIFPLKSVTNLKQAVELISLWIQTYYPEETELVTELSELGGTAPSDSLEISESFKLVINFLNTRTHAKVRPGKIKIFNTLEAAYFDEAQHLLFLGPALGRIPKNKSGSIFINSGILKILGLEREDNRVQRYLLERLSSRIKSVLIPRGNLAGDPISISPLFYPTESVEIANEVLRFYDVSEQRVLPQNVRTEIVHPLPLRDLTSIRNKVGVIQLSVTALDFYSVSPFKFYVERILQACTLTDDKRELEANQFGDLAHLVLRSVQKLSKDAALEEIDLVLGNELERASEKLYGNNLSAAVETQFYNLKERLGAYAKYELRSLRDGWKTIYSEKNAKPFTLNLPKEPIQLTARVDRIDFNEQLNAYRIWDYKTGDNLKGVFKKDQSLISLQLPLYAYFLSQGLFGDFHPGAPIEVGYIALGSMVSEPKPNLISERHLDEALLLARQAGENLLNCRFERGQNEKVNSASDFSMYVEYQALDFSEGEATRE